MHQLCFLINFDNLQQSLPNRFPLQYIIGFLVFSNNICVFSSYMNSQSVHKDSTGSRQSDLQYIAKKQNKFNSIFCRIFIHLVLLFLSMYCFNIFCEFVFSWFVKFLFQFFFCFSFKKERVNIKSGWQEGRDGLWGSEKRKWSKQSV